MSTKARHLHDDHTTDEEDNCSSSVRTNKFKVTVPIAPRFTCEDRLERRKEYYAKLDEKHKALEKEKLEAEARKKEEEEVAIKELRKTMVYKANPVPSFYRQGPSPEVKLKKLPLTRPKSPRLRRRRSCGDAGKTCQGDMGIHEQAARHSVTKGNEQINEPRSCDYRKSKRDPHEHEQEQEQEEEQEHEHEQEQEQEHEHEHEQEQEQEQEQEHANNEDE